MAIEATSIAGVFVISSDEHHDGRGFFRQSYQVPELTLALGRPIQFLQGNHSRSHATVLRGFHAEPWDKCIYVTRGTAICVVADIRPHSKTFGQSLMFILGDPPGRRIRLFVAEGLCNAFYCETEVDYLNEVSAIFTPQGRGGVAWNDPYLNVAWPNKNPVISDFDANLPKLQTLFPDRFT
jgi:dTDP-4-dehydrorhamnose 3,5-epimerase